MLITILILKVSKNIYFFTKTKDSCVRFCSKFCFEQTHKIWVTYCRQKLVLFSRSRLTLDFSCQVVPMYNILPRIFTICNNPLQTHFAKFKNDWSKEVQITRLLNCKHVLFVNILKQRRKKFCGFLKKNRRFSRIQIFLQN